MTSKININTIDSAFPVAGKDNNSQGFRDNFSNIKTALKTAADEISVLQYQSITKGTVDKDLPAINNLQGCVLSNFQHQNVSGTGYVVTVPTDTISPIVVSYPNGDVQQVILASNKQLHVSNWPTNEKKDTYSCVRISVTATVDATLSLTNPLGTVVTLNETEKVLYVKQGAVVFLDLWTVDQGKTVYAVEVGRSLYRSIDGIASGEISNRTAITYINLSSEITAFSLDAAPVNGQTKTIVVNDALENTSGIVIVKNAAWSDVGAIGFNRKAQGCVLQYVNNKWFAVSSNGATFS